MFRDLYIVKWRGRGREEWEVNVNWGSVGLRGTRGRRTFRRETDEGWEDKQDESRVGVKSGSKSMVKEVLRNRPE